MSNHLKTIGMHVTRYGLAIVLLWIGGMKFTVYEAEGIKPLVVNSPLMGWLYDVMTVGHAGPSPAQGCCAAGRVPFHCRRGVASESNKRLSIFLFQES